MFDKKKKDPKSEEWSKRILFLCQESRRKVKRSVESRDHVEGNESCGQFPIAMISTQCESMTSSCHPHFQCMRSKFAWKTCFSSTSEISLFIEK